MVRLTFTTASCAALVALAALALAGCHKTLVYGEQTGFNLAIQVNDDPKTPVQVNAGLKRTVGQLTPPTSLASDSNGSKADGDAVSTFSGFRLDYANDSVLLGKLTIKTQFATGAAALELAGNPEAAAAFLATDYDRPADHVSDESIARVDAIADVIMDSARLSDAQATMLACNPPLLDIATSSAREIDGDCQRTVDAGVARNYLLYQAGMGERSDEQLEAWEIALGLK